MTFVDPLSAVGRGQEWVKGLFDQQAQRQAGQAVARGDYTAGANTLFNRGDIAGGAALQDRNTALQTQQRETENRIRAQQLQTTLQVARALKGVRQQGDPLLLEQELARVRPTFLAMGTDPQQIAQIEAQVLANPGFLDDIEAITGQQLRELEIVNLGGGTAVAVDKGTGEEVNRYVGRQEPISVGGVLVDPVTYEPILDTRKPETIKVQNSDGSETILEVVAPTPRGATGSGFSSREDVLGFIAPIVGEFRPTSGARTQAEQDALVARGVTSARNSAHTNGLGQDIVPNAPLSQWERIAEDLRATGRFSRVIVETGQGRNQGTGAHIHLEPKVGGGEPQSGGGARVIAQGRDMGPTPSEARQQAREGREDLRAQGTLRREFNSRQEVKDFREVESAYNNVRTAATDPSAAGDLSLIFAYMKMLDPGSVVREQEFANAQNAAGVPDQIRNAYNRALNGERLNPRQRADFSAQAERLYTTRRQTYNRLVDEYRTEAELSGFDPNRIVPTRPAPAPAQRLRFQPTEAQTATSRRITTGQARGVRGTQTNPILINPSDPRGSYGNVRSGQYFITPDGEVRRKP